MRMSSQVTFPYKNKDDFGDVRTICERAGIDLRGEDGQPFHCEQRMQTKEGIMGPDYAKCRGCDLEILNLVSPHVNGGYILTDDVLDTYGNQLWTISKESNV